MSGRDSRCRPTSDGSKNNVVLLKGGLEPCMIDERWLAPNDVLHKFRQFGDGRTRPARVYHLHFLNS